MPNVRNRANVSSRLRLDPSVVWEDRTTLVKREVEAERAATDAKTAKLRALRLERDAADKLAVPLQETPTVTKRKRPLAAKA